MADWSTCPSQNGPARDAWILAQIDAGDFEVPLQAIEVQAGGHVGVVHVFSDALKVGGVRINVSADLQQQIADRLGAILLTPRLADLVWQNRVVDLDPKPMTITSSTAAMIEQSNKIENAIPDSDKGQPVNTVGKHWVLVKSIFSDSARAKRKAANYGWHFEGSNFQGIKGEPTVSLPGVRVIQGVGTVHDFGHTDYCLAPGTRVLKASLEWVPIEELVAGDELIGFDEHLRNPKLRRSVVQATKVLEQECYEIVTDRGTVVASGLHRWAVKNAQKVTMKYENGMTSTRRITGWVETQTLQAGQRICFFCEPWKQDTSWDGAWMAGIFDGEGWISGTSLGIGQNPGVVLDRAVSILSKNGFNTSFSTNKQGCVRVYIAGRRASLRGLGVFRPIRLLLKADQAWEGRRALGGGQSKMNTYAEVLDVRYLGKRTVIGLDTSTKTFIAEGFLSHNSQICQLVLRSCTVDGEERDLADIYTDPELSALVSHEGPLPGYRQPGVGESPPLSNINVQMPTTTAGTSTTKSSLFPKLIAGAAALTALGLALRS